MKMQTRHYVALGIITFLLGMLFYGLYNDMIILHLPSKKGLHPVHLGGTQRKNIKLIYSNGEQFITEEKEILISPNTQRTLNDILISWLNLLEEEKILLKKVSVQSVMTDKAGTEAYISFDRNPLAKEQSTYQKLLFIEGLLKTVTQSGLPFKSLRFLVNYKRLNDPHLDFSQSWPLSGFLTP